MTIIPQVSSIYLSTFNMNGKSITRYDAKQWLTNSNNNENNHAANDATASQTDLVLLSLQECPTYPSPPSTSRNGNINLDYDDDISNLNPCVCILGPPMEDNNKENDDLPSIISSVLSPNHVLIADIAMGEPPSSGGGTSTYSTESGAPSKESNNDINNHTSIEKYYGFIRLLVYAKIPLVKYILSSSQSCCNGQILIPVLSPTGCKQSSTYHSNSNQYEYKTKPSPDKGGVCLFIPSLELLICSIHLAGTNQYYTPESKFDMIRIQQLATIQKDCYNVFFQHEDKHEENNHVVINDNEGDANSSGRSELLLSFENYKVIVLGDLNFRVELKCNPDEKGRGGIDYQSVKEIIMSGHPENVHNLFWNHDRLVKLLSASSSEQYYHEMMTATMTTMTTTTKNTEKSISKCDLSMLQNVIDVFMEAFPKHGKTKGFMNILPTFTFELSSGEGKGDRKEKEQLQKKELEANTNDLTSKLLVQTRAYANKRTPSWTDRILIDQTLIQSNTGHSYDIHVLESKPYVTISDHIPVCCLLQLHLDCADNMS